MNSHHPIGEKNFRPRVYFFFGGGGHLESESTVFIFLVPLAKKKLHAV